MAFPSLSHSTPRESPTLATVSSLSDSKAIKQVVPEEKQRGEGSKHRQIGRIYLQLYSTFSAVAARGHVDQQLFWYLTEASSTPSTPRKRLSSNLTALFQGYLSLWGFFSYLWVLLSHSLLALSLSVIWSSSYMECTLISAPAPYCACTDWQVAEHWWSWKS